MEERKIIIDWLKAICIVLVILNHSNMFNKNSNPFFLLVIDIAVPVFMILSGYVFALTSNRKTFKECYEIKNILKKIIKFTVPMIITYTLYIIIHNNCSFLGALKILILGQYGQGAYYYALLLEFIILAPILLYIVKRKRIYIVFIINLLYEFICHYTYINGAIYRILVFRYITMISCGMYLYFLSEDIETKKVSANSNKKCINENDTIFSTHRKFCILLLIGFPVGVLYKIAPAFGYTYHFFSYMPWARTSMISTLYVLPVTFMLILLENKSIFKYKCWGGVTTIGKASYHIMYTQMLYYDLRVYFDKFLIDISKLRNPLELFINIIVCVLIGLFFYYFDTKYITGKIIKFFNYTNLKR